MKFIFLSFLLLLSCRLIAQDDTQARKDSLSNRIAATEGKEKLKAYRLLTTIYFMESSSDDLKMDTLLALYRKYDAEALRQKDYITQGIIRANTIIAYSNRNDYDEILKLAPDYLAYLAKHEAWQAYYSIYRSVLQVYLNTGEYEKALDGAQQMYSEAKQRNRNDGKGMALYVISKAYDSMSRFEDEEKYLRECIETIKNDDSMMWLAAEAYSRLCSALIILERYDEAAQQLQEFEKINYRYEEVSKSKQLVSWGNLWNGYMSLYFKKGDYDKAEVYCDKLDSIGARYQKYNVYTIRSKICFERKQYDKALEMADKAAELSGGDPVSVNADQGLKLMVLCGKKGVMDIYQLFEQSAGLRDSIRNVSFNAQLDKLRTEYEVDKITGEKKRNHNYFLFALGGCIFLVIILVIWIYYSRSIVRKNKALYLQIKERDRLEEELKQAVAGGSPENLPGDRQQRQLVERFCDNLLNERNFAKPEINLDELISKLATNRTYLFDAVKTVMKKTPLEYIHSLQLEEAKKMLETNFELNIEIIAENCGFNSRSNFYRLFHERYQITPTEYRKMTRRNFAIGDSYQ